MIILCEPQCRRFSHEQFNAGILYGYLLAYPEEKIVFFAEKEHIMCIKDVFISANLSLNKVEFIETIIPDSKELARLCVILKYYFLLKNIFNYAFDKNCFKIVFLSIYAFNMFPLKYLLFKNKNIFHLHIGMHGTLEFVKRKNTSFYPQLILRIVNQIIKHLKIKTIEIKKPLVNKYLYEKTFAASLKIFGNKNITYYAFRDDIPGKVGKYLPNICQYFKSIDLPYIYKDPIIDNTISTKRKKIFATIGQGNLNSVYEIAKKISQDSYINEYYEFRIIGGDNKEALHNGLNNVIQYYNNLKRSEIEELSKEVHYFLFFYNSDFYNLTTSGSFFDAIAYCKPIIFLKNNCFDFYFQKYNFGYRCGNLTEMINVLTNIIVLNDNNYKKHISEIIRMRNDISIKNNYAKLKFI